MYLDIILLVIIGISVALAIIFLVKRHKKCACCPYSTSSYHKEHHNFNCKGCKGNNH